MNEKIKKLAEQAGATVNERSGWTDYGTIDLDVEKFAELIVAECADLCDRYQKIPATEPRHCANDIRSMFGIKQPEEEENE
jgi:hypothetical protein